MLINKDSLIINNVSMAKYLIQAEFQFHKTWGDDTGRNTLSGDFSGTFKGIFPELILTFKRLNQSQIEEIAPILDAPEQSVTYYDPIKKGNLTIATYSDDWGYVNKRIGIQEGINLSFVARKRRKI